MAVGLRKQIQLVKVTNVKLATGEWGQPTKTRYNYWAEVVKSSGNSSFKDSQTQLGERYRFKVRYNGTFDLSAKWTVIYRGNDFTVSSITRDREKDFYWIIEASTSHG